VHCPVGPRERHLLRNCCFLTDDEIIYLEQPNKSTEKLLKLIEVSMKAELQI